MKKRSIFTTGVLLLTVGNLLWNSVDLYQGTKEFQQKTYEELAHRALDQMHQLKIKTEGFNISGDLQTRQDSGRIGFFILQSDRQPASSSLPDLVDPSFSKIVDGNPRVLKDGESGQDLAIYVSDKVQNQEVTLGMFVDHDFFARTAAFNAKGFWRNFMVQLGLILLVLYYTHRDLIHIFKNLQWNGLRHFRTAQVGPSIFRETAALNDAMTRASEKIRSTQGQIENMRSHIFPSLLREIDSGLQPPYEFQSILIRIDINDSTRVYSTPKLKPVQEVWFDYFKVKSAEIATRYGGFYHEDIGDEVIFYVKKETAEISSALAVSIVRDVFSLAEEIDQKTFAQYGYHFHVKAALDAGPLRVFKSSLSDRNDRSRYKIEGAGHSSRNPLLRTKRMLDWVTNRDANSCVVENSVAVEASSLIAQKKLESRELPGPDGIAEKSDVIWIAEFQEFKLTEEPPKTLLFRKDLDLIAIVQLLISGNCASEEVCLQWIQTLRDIRVADVTLDLQNHWLSLLGIYVAHIQQDRFLVATATLLALTPQFVSRENPPPEIFQILQKCFSFAQERIQANALEAWSELEGGPSLGKSVRKFKHNRVLANALVLNLKLEIRPQQLRALKAMLKHENPFMKASGCFALTQVYGHYLKADPIILEVNANINELRQMTLGLTKDSNEMVRRQARRFEKLIAA